MVEDAVHGVGGLDLMSRYFTAIVTINFSDNARVNHKGREETDLL